MSVVYIYMCVCVRACASVHMLVMVFDDDGERACVDTNTRALMLS